jgi:hypothetical protein
VVVVVVVVGTLTTMVAGEPVIAVCALPAASVTEKLEARVSTIDPDAPYDKPASTLTEQVNDETRVTDVIVPPVIVKSTPGVADSELQSIGSFPVTRNELTLVEEDEAEPNESVGAMTSLGTTVGVAALGVEDPAEFRAVILK